MNKIIENIFFKFLKIAGISYIIYGTLISWQFTQLGLFGLFGFASGLVMIVLGIWLINGLDLKEGEKENE